MTGCGFNPKDDETVLVARAAILTYCSDELNGALGDGPGGDRASQEDALDTLVATYREQPEAMRPVLSDLADRLRDCAPSDSRRLLNVLR